MVTLWIANPPCASSILAHASYNKKPASAGFLLYEAWSTCWVARTSENRKTQARRCRVGVAQKFSIILCVTDVSPTQERSLGHYMTGTGFVFFQMNTFSKIYSTFSSPLSQALQELALRTYKKTHWVVSFFICAQERT